MQAANKRRWVWLAVGAIALLAVFSATAIATDSPRFCPTCHEMGPYYSAWMSGPHSGVSCVDCHVGTSVPKRFGHKFVALGEVWAHFTGDTKFPGVEAPSIPDEHCRECHRSPSNVEMLKSFDHVKHESYERCQHCHSSTGHDVTAKALTFAGVYDATNALARARALGQSGAKAVPGKGKANLKGHLPVSCTSCHDMVRTGCATCHDLPEKHRWKGDCAVCHAAGEAFEFRHPLSAKCGECHKAPVDEHPLNDDCALCHVKSGKSWAFAHPSGGDCAQCHKLPAGDHPSNPTCAECHKAQGTSWAFTHPDGTDCSECHTAPGGKHPTNSDCSACHKSTGDSWVFRHTGDTGEHSYRSFACTKCHPQDYERASCTCHKNGVPDED